MGEGDGERQSEQISISDPAAWDLRLIKDVITSKMAAKERGSESPCRRLSNCAKWGARLRTFAKDEW